MPRAHRIYCRGFIWHITHRCQQKEFLLKFARDRRTWRNWLFEARRRYGLCVLNYIVTSNHVHLLVADQGSGEIAASMQLVAGQTAREYNRRKQRRGSFWEDRYHTTAVQTGHHLIRCLSYIDLNMVRAGVVDHPQAWNESGYHEIQNPRVRKGVINHQRLCELVGVPSLDELQAAHSVWIEQALRRPQHDPVWTESVAVGDEIFLCSLKDQLGSDGRHRRVSGTDGLTCLKEAGCRYRPIFPSKSGD